MYKLVFTNNFKKDYKRIQKRGYDTTILLNIFQQLKEKANVDLIYKPHKLLGKYSGYWECHIKSDWLLIWSVNEEQKIVNLLYTGTHNDLF